MAVSSKRIGLLALLLALALLTGAPAAAAQQGVGVNLSDITINERLTPGDRYTLPTLGVLNTGDVAGRYEVVITYLQDQKELQPHQDWFRFDPQTFDLEAGQSQSVSISLHLPGGAEPGRYFAFIEAHPTSDQPGITIGVAAATKLSFEVEPSSLWTLWRLRIAHFFEDNSPFSIVLPPTLAGLLLLYFLSRRFRLRVERRG